MKLKLTLTMIAALLVALPFAAPVELQAQGVQTRTLSGIWHPVVGSGGAYEWTIGDDKHPLETTVVGKEEVEGKPAYWLETMLSNPKGALTYYKVLMVLTDSGVTSTRTIVQMSGLAPKEMDTSKSPASERTRPIDMRDQADFVGTETITVPAGTFTCDHYRAKDGSSEVWVSDKISPWGLVKTQGKTSSMVLTKVITDAKEHIIGKPKKLEPKPMMPDRPSKQAQ